MQTSGRITYNGHTFDEFVAQRTSSYISQTDNHIGELTVRETLDFAARCQGVGYKYGPCSSLDYSGTLKLGPSAAEAFLEIMCLSVTIFDVDNWAEFINAILQRLVCSLKQPRAATFCCILCFKCLQFSAFRFNNIMDSIMNLTTKVLKRSLLSSRFCRYASGACSS